MRSYKIVNAAVMAKWPTLDLADAKNKYHAHKNYARGRNDTLGNPIEFKLTFEEWIDIWMASGHWDERGRGRGKYCMARNNDIGHYEVGNVKIVLNEKNISEAHKGKEKGPFSAEHKKKLSVAKKGIPPHNKGKKTGPNSIESNAKRSATMTGKKKTPEHIANAIAGRKAKRIEKEPHEPSNDS